MRELVPCLLLFCAWLAMPMMARPEETQSCERQWTFPVPFYQSVAWSPDGSRIAFAAVTTSWDDGYRIFLVNEDGSGLKQLDIGDTEALYPVFSPDGTQIAFMSRGDDNRDVYLIGVDGSGLTRLTEHEASDGYPSWSPAGDRIAFHSDRDGNYEIYVMNSDGTEPVRLTDHPADDYNPAWSPDGSHIAFDSNRDDVEGDEIYLIAADGSALFRVVDQGVFPTWSPDDAKLLFTWEDLFVIGADGSGRRRLLEDSVYAAWSPDGSRIVATATEFDEDCQDHHSLVLLRADGTPVRRLLPRE